MTSIEICKRLIAHMPVRWQSEMKRIYYGRKIRSGTFKTSEPEYEMLPDFIHPGDWVIDIGANVGHYTKRFSELVGSAGRVIALEPVPATFSLLAANVQLFAHANVTLINAAVSDMSGVAGIAIPTYPNGLTNYCRAHLSPGNDEHACAVLALPMDSFCLDHRIALIKIDTEGHELPVLKGMWKLLAKFHPILIIETESQKVISNLSELGYVPEKLHNSPNMIFKVKA